MSARITHGTCADSSTATTATRTATTRSVRTTRRARVAVSTTCATTNAIAAAAASRPAKRSALLFSSGAASAASITTATSARPGTATGDQVAVAGRECHEHPQPCAERDQHRGFDRRQREATGNADERALEGRDRNGEHHGRERRTGIDADDSGRPHLWLSRIENGTVSDTCHGVARSRFCAIRLPRSDARYIRIIRRARDMRHVANGLLLSPQRLSMTLCRPRSHRCVHWNERCSEATLALRACQTSSGWRHVQLPTVKALSRFVSFRRDGDPRSTVASLGNGRTLSLIAYKTVADGLSKLVSLAITVAAARLLSGEDFGDPRPGDDDRLAAQRGERRGTPAVSGEASGSRRRRPVIARHSRQSPKCCGSAACSAPSDLRSGWPSRSSSRRARRSLRSGWWSSRSCLNAVLETLAHAYRGLGRSDIESTIVVSQRLVTAAAAIVALQWSPSLPLLATALVVPPAVALAASVRTARRLLAIGRVGGAVRHQRGASVAVFACSRGARHSDCRHSISAATCSSSSAGTAWKPSARTTRRFASSKRFGCFRPRCSPFHIPRCARQRTVRLCVR